LESERKYARTLSEIIAVFATPIVNQSLLSPEEVKKLFLNITEIYNFHVSLLAKLEDRMKEWTPRQLLGDVLLGLNISMSIYQDYINSYDPTILPALININKKFASFVERKYSPENSSSGSKYLESLLITPVQRLPRYEMLLKDLMRNTLSDHPDYKGLSDAYRSTKNVNDVLNRKRGIVEETLTKPHKFEAKSFNVPIWCNQCDSFIWGVGRSGFVCVDCGVAVHLQCLNSVTGKCPSKSGSPEKKENKDKKKEKEEKKKIMKEQKEKEKEEKRKEMKKRKKRMKKRRQIQSENQKGRVLNILMKRSLQPDVLSMQQEWNQKRTSQFLGNLLTHHPNLKRRSLYLTPKIVLRAVLMNQVKVILRSQ